MNVLTFLSKSFAFLHSVVTVMSFAMHCTLGSYPSMLKACSVSIEVAITKCADSRIRVEHMERQLANLTGLVQKALTQTPPPREYLQVPPPPSARDANYRNGAYSL
jgi:hypothetical protein